MTAETGNPLLDLTAAGIRAALKPTDEISSLSPRAKPPVLWGRSRRIQVGSEQDRQRERYRDAEWERVEQVANAFHAVLSAGRVSGERLAQGMRQFASAAQRT